MAPAGHNGPYHTQRRHAPTIPMITMAGTRSAGGTRGCHLRGVLGAAAADDLERQGSPVMGGHRGHGDTTADHHTHHHSSCCPHTHINTYKKHTISVKYFGLLPNDGIVKSATGVNSLQLQDISFCTANHYSVVYLTSIN